MFNIKKQLLLIGLFMAARFIVTGQSGYCGDLIPSSSSAAFIYIYQGTPIELNGEALEYGSHIIAVFQDSNGDWKCAGQAQWWGYNTILTVRGADSEVEGYDEGETFRFYVQLPDDCVLQEVEAEFIINTQFPAGNTFTQAGNSRLASLSATFDSMLQSTIFADTCETSTGQVSIDIISGVSVSSISWSDGQEGFNAIDLPEGMISAQITTEEGCTFSSSFEIPAVACPLLECNATCNGFLEGDQGCLPFTTVFMDNSLFEAAIQSYFWDFGDGNTSTEANPIHIYTTPGTYTVNFTIADNYRTDSQSFEVVVYPIPTASWSYEPNICQPQIITFSSESNDNIASWNWSFSDSQSANTSSATIDFVDNGVLINGTLDITDENGCSEQLALAIEVPDAYDLEIIPENIQMPNCMEANGSISVTPDGGIMPYSYNWAHDATNDTDTSSMLVPGAYSLFLTDGNGCEDSLTITLEDNTEVPMPNLGEDTSFCMNEIITLNSGVNGETFQWYINGMSINDANDPSYTPQQSGTYEVVVSNTDNCIGADTIVVDMLPLPIIDLGPDQSLCSNLSALLEVFCEGCSYLWNDGTTSPSLEALPGAEYAITVVNADNCMFSDTISIDVLQTPDVNLGEDIVFCDNEIMELDAGISNGDFQWYFEGMPITGANTQTYIPEQSGTYIAAVNNADNCMDSDTILVNILTTPILNLGPDQNLCPNQTTTLDASCDDCNYQWNNGEISASIEGFPENEYTVTVVNINNCIISDTIVINALQAPVVSLGNDQIICEGELVHLGDTAILGNTYVWSTGDTSAEIEVTENGQYNLSITNTEGCTASDSVLINFIAQPNAVINTSAEQICAGEAVQLIATGGENYIWLDTSFTITTPDLPDITVLPEYTTEYGFITSNDCYSDTAYTIIQVSQPYLSAPIDTCIALGKQITLEAPLANAYSWWEAGQDNPISTNAILTVSPDTSSLYYLQMTDTLGCIFLDSVLVAVLQLESLELDPVAIITPNGDGYNDVLSFTNITKFSPRTLTVFNRWGGIVYDSFNYQNDWDGTREGEPLPDGVYYYILRIGVQEIKHSLTIIRD